MLVPSEEFQDGLSALQSALADHVAIRAAVAFVTRRGVEHLASLLNGVHVDSLQVAARAADVTEPEAIKALRDELGADVSVVIGAGARQFHPKLWIVTHPDKVVVISGSGNLTHGGLVANDEQFELIEFDRQDPAVQAHHDRFDALTAHALPLEAVEHAAIWKEWEAVRKKQARLLSELARIEKAFLERTPIADRSVHKAQLIADLQQIYDETVAADLPRADGERYYPTRLLVAINAARDGQRDPVRVVSDTIRRHTEGLDILLEAGLIELTLEWLVADESRPYHDLFSSKSVELARVRIEAFRKVGHDIPEAGTARRPRAADVMTNEQIADYLHSLVDQQLDGYQLPRLHTTDATLVKIEGNHALVRRGSGTIAKIPIRLVRLRLTDLASEKRLRVSELKENPSDRFTAALGPLLAVFPGVVFDERDKRLGYARDIATTSQQPAQPVDS